MSPLDCCGCVLGGGGVTANSRLRSPSGGGFSVLLGADGEEPCPVLLVF